MWLESCLRSAQPETDTVVLPHLKIVNMKQAEIQRPGYFLFGRIISFQPNKEDHNIPLAAGDTRSRIQTPDRSPEFIKPLEELTSRFISFLDRWSRQDFGASR